MPVCIKNMSLPNPSPSSSVVPLPLNSKRGREPGNDRLLDKFSFAMHLGLFSTCAPPLLEVARTTAVSVLWGSIFFVLLIVVVFMNTSSSWFGVGVFCSLRDEVQMCCDLNWPSTKESTIVPTYYHLYVWGVPPYSLVRLGQNGSFLVS